MYLYEMLEQEKRLASELETGNWLKRRFESEAGKRGCKVEELSCVLGYTCDYVRAQKSIEHATDELDILHQQMRDFFMTKS